MGRKAEFVVGIILTLFALVSGCTGSQSTTFSAEMEIVSPVAKDTSRAPPIYGVVQGETYKLRYTVTKSRWTIVKDVQTRIALPGEIAVQSGNYNLSGPLNANYQRVVEIDVQPTQPGLYFVQASSQAWPFAARSAVIIYAAEDVTEARQLETVDVAGIVDVNSLPPIPDSGKGGDIVIMPPPLPSIDKSKLPQDAPRGESVPVHDPSP